MSNIDWSQIITVEQRAEKRRQNLAAYAALKRWQIETGGIDVQGIAIRTDRESQGMLTNAALAAQIDATLETNWKCADGSFVALSAAQVIAIAKAVTAHVQRCFACEAEVVSGIRDSEISDTAQIDAAFESMKVGHETGKH